MASLDNFLFVSNLCQIILLLFIFNLPNIFSQDSRPSSPTITQCTSSLITLIPCTPFVQGTAPSPGSQCCGNLKQIYSQEPQCLCLLLNSTSLSALPINRTLALQLPAFCTLQVNISSCLVEQVHKPTRTPLHAKNNSTVNATPAFSVSPRPNGMRFSFGSSQGTHLKKMNKLVVIILFFILIM